MSSGTQVEQDNFKATIKQFIIQFNTIQAKLDLAVKDKQLQVLELFAVVKLQNAMVFGLDDKPIVGIERTSGLVLGSGFSIALNPIQKQKQDEVNKPFQDVILLLETFERSTAILAEVLVRTKRVLSLPTRPAVATVLIAANAESIESSRAGLNSSAVGLDGLTAGLDGLSQALYKQMSDMKNCIEERMDNQWNDIQEKLDRILVVIDMLASNNN